MPIHIIKDGKIINTILSTLAEAAIAYPDCTCLDASSGGAIGDSYNGETFTAPSRYASIEEAKIAKINDLAAYRYEREVAGITVNGVIIKTDRESQGLFHRIWTKAQIDSDITIKWKGANTWAQIGKAEIDAIEPILFTYIEKCFEVEGDHSDAILLLTTIAQVEAYDITTGWPDNK